MIVHTEAALKLFDRLRFEQNEDGGLVSMNYKVYAVRYTDLKYSACSVNFARCGVSETEYGANVRGERDELVVHIFKYKSEGEPDRKIIPAYQSFQMMTTGRVIPGADAHTSSQRPSGGVFDYPDACDVDHPARHPRQMAHRIMQRLEQENGHAVEREAPQV